jgi:proteasome lid subunit RPN8/RPN11
MLKFAPALLDQVRAHGEETYPHECCGVLLGRMSEDGSARLVDEIVCCANARVDSPQNRYHIDPRDLVRVQRESRDRQLDIIGFYHSHPDHPARWSKTDLEEAHWLGCSYVITSVENGHAAQSNSFQLVGDSEEQKQFRDEEIEVC